MICLTDPRLIMLDLSAWAIDRSMCLAPAASMSQHIDWVQKYGVGLLWSDDFYSGIPFNNPNCPPDLIGHSASLVQFLARQDANGLLSRANITGAIKFPVISPDIFHESRVAQFRLRWLHLLGHAICTPELVGQGFGVLTWESGFEPSPGELAIVNRSDLGALLSSVKLISNQSDREAFVNLYHRPNLAGKRIAVIGGERGWFERARSVLIETFGAAECVRLPPSYESHRSEQQTRQQLTNKDMVVMCEGRMKHVDSQQVHNLAASGAIKCPIVHANAGTSNNIIDAVVSFYRQAELKRQ